MTPKLILALLLNAVVLVALDASLVAPWFPLRVAAACVAGVAAVCGVALAVDDLLDRLRAYVLDGLRRAEVVDEWLEEEADDDVRREVTDGSVAS